MEFDLLINFFLAAGIGAIIGLEREIVHQKRNVHDFAGMRTFILIAIFGFMIAHITINIFNSVAAFIVGFAVLSLFIVAAYSILAMKTGRPGATTEIAAIITFFLAVIVTLDVTQKLRLTAIIITIVVASLLALKERLHKFARDIHMSEVYATIKMAAVSVLILPLLPNKNYTLLDIPYLRELILTSPKISEIVQQMDVFNPFKIWLFVVLITGLSFIGYILIKTVGVNKGIGITSLLGGIVSSTAVTISLSEKSKNKKIFAPFVFGIVLASSVMFARVLILVAAVNSRLLSFIILPLGAMALTGLLASFIITKTMKEESKEKTEFKTPFAIGPGLKFGVFFVFILALSKLLYILIGDKGVYLAGLVSGLADVDAITITLSSWASSGTLAERIAVIGIILAVSANTVVKATLTFLTGNRKVAKWVIGIFALILIVGLSIAFFM